MSEVSGSESKFDNFTGIPELDSALKKIESADQITPPIMAKIFWANAAEIQRTIEKPDLAIQERDMMQRALDTNQRIAQGLEGEDVVDAGDVVKLLSTVHTYTKPGWRLSKEKRENLKRAALEIAWQSISE